MNGFKSWKFKLLTILSAKRLLSPLRGVKLFTTFRARLRDTELRKRTAADTRHDQLWGQANLIDLFLPRPTFPT
jgi:hypothetical protein